MSISYRSAGDLAVEYIRELIHSGRLEPGAKIGIDELVAEMKVSSTPIRDSLRRLEAEGLVEIVPRVGVFIRHIPPAEVLEVYAIKQSLDPLLMFWATQRGSDEDVQAFVATVDQLAALAKVADAAAYIDVVEQRRAILFRMAASDVLRACFQSIDGRVRWLRYQNLAQPARMRQSIREHRAVARAVIDRDAERAAELTAEHVRSATRSLAALIEDPPAGTVLPNAFLDWRQAALCI